MKTYLELHKLSQSKAHMNNMHVPSDIGRIPREIETKFAGFTADQYKNWVILYSIPSMYSILEGEHLQCWRHFVLACRLLCKRILTESDIILADAFLIRFVNECNKSMEREQ